MVQSTIEPGAISPVSGLGEKARLLLDLLAKEPLFSPSALNIIRASVGSSIDITALVEAVSADPVISASVLALAASPIYAHVTPPKSIRQAVMTIGSNRLTAVALASALSGETFRALDDSVRSDVLAAWRHVVAVASIAEIEAGAAGVAPDLAYTIGLFARLSTLSIVVRCRPLIEQLGDRFRQGAPDRAAEMEILGATKAELSAALIASWGVQGAVVSSVAAVDDPDSGDPAARCAEAGCHMAGFVGYPMPQPWMVMSAPRAVTERVLSDASGIDSLAREVRRKVNAVEVSIPRGVDAGEYTWNLLSQAGRRLAELLLRSEQDRADAESRNRDFARIAQVLSRVAMGLDFQSLSYSLLEVLIECFGACCAAVALKSGDSDVLKGHVFRLDAEKGPSAAGIEVGLRELAPRHAEVLEKGSSAILEGAPGGWLAKHFPGAGGVVLAGLVVRGRPQGLLILAFPPEARWPRTGAGSAMELIANVAALALDNARLFELVRLESTTDELTRTMNRRAVLRFAEVRLTGATGASGGALVMIDLDHFKAVNDTLGHDAGDEFLREVSQILTRAVEGRGRVGRPGGDEFIVVMPRAVRADVEAFCDRVLADVGALAACVPWKDVGAPVGITLGATVSSAAEPDIRTLLRKADQALYAAKNAGRNRWSVV